MARGTMTRARAKVAPFRRAMRCPVLTYECPGSMRRMCYAMSGTDTAMRLLARCREHLLLSVWGGTTHRHRTKEARSHPHARSHRSMLRRFRFVLHAFAFVSMSCVRATCCTHLTWAVLLADGLP
eukprot:2684417-Rhodomonas_salina.1